MQYTAEVENPRGERSTLTLEICGADPTGAFDWACQNQRFKRVGPLVDYSRVSR